MLLPNPSKIDKFLYIDKTPNWKIYSFYSFGIFSWILISIGYLSVIGLDPFYTFIIAPIMIFLTIYQLFSFSLNLFYKQFNKNKHLEFINEYWKEGNEPSVDIFLPISGEDILILENTWHYVNKLDYKNYKVYVLDDSKNYPDQIRDLCRKYGFSYLRRQNVGEMKKAGNLKYGFENSTGEYIIIFDADFAPNSDFIKHTLPYMTNKKIGILQTPQYFDNSMESYKSSKIAYNSAFAEEPFYRFIQVSRSRFNGTICCGSNAVYRRSALEEIGGPYQIEHSEDAHTGFELVTRGYLVSYMPVILAMGLCPDNNYTFFHQQHRWCMGSMSMMFSRRFWFASVSWKTKFCYITGFMFYLHNPLIFILPLQLFWVLFIYNDFVPKGISYLYLPNIIFSFIFVFLFQIAKFKPGYFSILISRIYAYSHAVTASIFKRSVGWVSTNTRQRNLSKAYQQTLIFSSIYMIIFIYLILLGIKIGDIKIFNYKYWSLQLWIIYDFVLTVIFVWINISTALEIIRKDEYEYENTKLEINKT